MSFLKVVHTSRLVLTEGALVERLKTEFHLGMDPHVNHAALIYTHPHILETLYRQYIDIAKQYHLPILLTTPTRRLNSETHADSAYRDRDLFADSCSFLKTIRKSYGSFSENIMLGGLQGCRGDAYSGTAVMTRSEAYQFHRLQSQQFLQQKMDFLFAGIMPELQEATGMAMAMAETGLPYTISFMIRKNGRLLDGTLLAGAIAYIDSHVDPKPAFYMTNCIHPGNLLSALSQGENSQSQHISRLAGIQANASRLSPEELNNCPLVQQDDFAVMIDEILQLRQQFGLKIFGGCCGTNDQFLAALAAKLNQPPQPDELLDKS